MQEETSSIPEETTATTVPEEPTAGQAPEETTPTPEETTSAQEETTTEPAPEKTTPIPEETTSAPEETTTEPAQEETTSAQEETATEQAPEETTSVQEETTSVSEEETIDEPAPNLLKNPEWKSGAVGWIVTSGNQETEFEGHSCLSSTNSQSITVTDEMVGKVLKFSGSIATASSDSTQEAIGLMITSYKDDDTVIATDTVIEEGKDLTPHEVLVDITPDTAYVRVSVTIWKQGTKNIFNFSDLRLEETDTSFVRE